jgi:hypothetical protein
MKPSVPILVDKVLNVILIMESVFEGLKYQNGILNWKLVVKWPNKLGILKQVGMWSLTTMEKWSLSKGTIVLILILCSRVIK